MNWGAWVAAMLLEHGPEILGLCESVIKAFGGGGLPTPEQWAELRAIGAQTSKDRMAAMLTKAGVALDNPVAVSLLALTTSQ